MEFLKQETIDRFWAKVDKTPGHGPWGNCWIWTANRNCKDYGAFGVPSGQPYKQISWKAHRLSWVLENGDIPDNLQVLHRCDNPPCVNPVHLFLGTNRDNMLDSRIKRGSIKKETVRIGAHYLYERGERHHNAKLSDEQVAEIRKRRGLYGTSYAQLAREYQISASQAYRIGVGESR